MHPPLTTSKVAILAGASLFLNLTGKAETSNEAPTRGTVLTIATANTTTGKYQQFEGPGNRIFQALKPDIAAIQEFNVPDKGGLRAWIDRVFGKDFHYMIEPGNDQIPCGIVSRYPITASGEWNDPQVGNRDFAWATINIPGAIDLHIISVHLHGSGKSTSRNIEAEVIVNAAKKQFPASDYLVLCGDLNTRNRKEAAIGTFAALFSDKHVPTDQNGNSFTSKNRNYAYDWVMPNLVLDKLHHSLSFGGKNFPHGLVFDTRLWSPAPAPALTSDSAAGGMQHMAVMKAFLLPVSKTPAKIGK